MPNGLERKSVIVTGAAYGVGRAIARRFARAGAWVVMSDMDAARLEIEVEAVEAEGFDGRVLGFTGDVRERLTIQNLMAATLEAHEGFDVLVNASRLVVGADPLNAEDDRFEAVMAQNVTATLRLCQIAARRMIQLGKNGDATRAIVNISAVEAWRSPPKLLGYSVSCAALNQLTRGLAVALAGNGIRVNAVAVGGVLGRSLIDALSEVEDLSGRLEDVVPLGRLGEVAEIAEAAMFLASPAASFVTGQILAVDGGRLLLDPLNVTT